MKEKSKLTRQGIRDLNYYGPKPRPAVAVALKSPEDAVDVAPPAVQPQVADAPQRSEK